MQYTFPDVSGDSSAFKGQSIKYVINEHYMDKFNLIPGFL